MKAITWCLLFWCLLFLSGSPAFGQTYREGSLILVDTIPSGNVVASYTGFDKGGNTSATFENSDSYKWSGQSPFPSSGFGYFDSEGTEHPYLKRDRDLGQTFECRSADSLRMKGIVLKLGLGDKVVREGILGETLSLQIFRVSGTPVLNQNGSDSTMEGFHGFPHDRKSDEIPSERDDFFTGESYESLAVITGFRFPELEDFGFDANEEVHPDHPLFKGRLMYFRFPESSEILLDPGESYAFLIIVDNRKANNGFTLANNYWGSYEGGHGIRRSGNGIFPPSECDPGLGFRDPVNRDCYESGHFPDDRDRRLAISPETNGYPDVDTWRDLFFYVLGE